MSVKVEVSIDIHEDRFTCCVTVPGMQMYGHQVKGHVLCGDADESINNVCGKALGQVISENQSLFRSRLGLSEDTVLTPAS